MFGKYLLGGKSKYVEYGYELNRVSVRDSEAFFQVIISGSIHAKCGCSGILVSLHP